MKTILINNKDLAFTIDTYGMFTGDGVYEQEIDYYQDEYNLTDDELDNFGFNFDHPAIVRDLAEASVSILEQNIVRESEEKIVYDIKLGDTRSPKFYNYTTDSYDATWTIDEAALEAYCLERKDALHKFIDEEWTTTPIDEEDALVMKLDFYTRQVLEEDTYNMEMWEYESEIYMNHMEPDEESAAIIQSKVCDSCGDNQVPVITFDGRKLCEACDTRIAMDLQ